MTFNTRELEQFVAGWGTSPESSRFLHFRDESHSVRGDEKIIHIDEAFHRALVAGGYRNLVLESSVETHDSYIHQRYARILQEERGLWVTYPDARRAEKINLIRSELGDETANFIDNHFEIFIRALYISDRSDRELTAYFEQRIAEHNRNFQPVITTSAAEFTRTFRATERHVNQLIIDTDVNQRSIDNILRETTIGERAQYKVAVFYGAAHYNGTIPQLPDMDSGAMEGMGVSLILPENQASELRRLQRGTTQLPDPPDFLFIAATGRMIDNRAPDMQTPSLQTILARGDTALRPPAASVGTTQREEETAAPATTTTHTESHATTTDDTPDTTRNLPWGNLIGAAIGAFFTSGMGRGQGGNFGIGSILALAFGGLIGWFLGGAFTNGHSNPLLRMLTGEHNGPAPTTEHDAGQSQPAISHMREQSTDASLAFARVSSVDTSYEVASASPADTFESPSRFLTPPVTENAARIYP